MAVVNATTPSGGNNTTMRSRPISDMKLPTSRTKPSTNLADYLLFIYGQKKVGKTTLASQFPNSLHLFFEPGGKGIETYALEPQTVSDCKEVIRLLKSSDGDAFENIILDTVDILWDMVCRDHCERNLISHINDKNDFGKTQDMVTTEFAELMQSFRHTGKGVIAISHAKEAEIKTRNQGTWTRYIPTLKDRPKNWLSGAADIIGYYGYFGAERRLVIDGSDLIEAGCRLKHNFRTPDGQRVVSIPAGADDETAYANLMAAFRNEQEVSGADVHGTVPTMVNDLASALKAVPLTRKG